MEEIIADCKRPAFKIYAKLFMISKPWRRSFQHEQHSVAHFIQWQIRLYIAKPRPSTNQKSCLIVIPSVINIVFEFTHTRYQNKTIDFFLKFVLVWGSVAWRRLQKWGYYVYYTFSSIPTSFLLGFQWCPHANVHVRSKEWRRDIKTHGILERLCQVKM